MRPFDRRLHSAMADIRLIARENPFWVKPIKGFTLLPRGQRDAEQ
jgi:hypothetical protein